MWVKTILSLLKGLLSVSTKVMDYLNKKQMMDAGASRQVASNLRRSHELIDKAIKAGNRIDRHRLTNKQLQHDKFNRDNR